MKAAIYARTSTIAITFLAMLLFPLLVTASDKNGAYSHMIATDDATCGSYVSARDDARRGNHFRENKYGNWLAGYITAFNSLTPDTNDIKGTADMSSLLLWLENYCKQHPLIDFVGATEILMAELYPKRTRQAPK